jgi:hypothetical protein
VRRGECDAQVVVQHVNGRPVHVPVAHHLLATNQWPVHVPVAYRGLFEKNSALGHERRSRPSYMWKGAIDRAGFGEGMSGPSAARGASHCLTQAAGPGRRTRRGEAAGALLNTRPPVHPSALLTYNLNLILSRPYRKVLRLIRTCGLAHFRSVHPYASQSLYLQTCSCLLLPLPPSCWLPVWWTLRLLLRAPCILTLRTRNAR